MYLQWGDSSELRQVLLEDGQVNCLGSNLPVEMRHRWNKG